MKDYLMVEELRILTGCGSEDSLQVHIAMIFRSALLYELSLGNNEELLYVVTM
jgi:hypothetical protein